MSNVSQAMKLTRRSLLALSVVMLFGCASESMQQSKALSLTGAEEVPPVSTTGSGSGQITVAGDRSVSGSITVAGFTPTAAHIHEAGMGKNGPVIIPLTKTSDTTFVVPPGAKLTDAQYSSYQAGNLYVNAHSAKNPGGEVRAQLSPGGSSTRSTY
jgi:hypothetical protein